MSKELIIISGPNGSGKTTFAKSFLGFENFKFLNADEITIELEIQNEKVRNYITGREYFKRLEKLSKSNNNIILESTLSGKSLSKHIKELKRKEYSVKIIFVMLNGPKQCIERIKHRVSKGGHHVPDEDVIRRYDRGLKNFWRLYKGLVDEWRLYNNSESGYEFVAGGNASKFEIADEKLFNDFLSKLSL